jgi:N-acetylglucosaminyl-diphospho-decaprenol L-rhamnosyltransferase
MENLTKASVYAIIVTYNGLAWIDRCLSSLQNSTYPLEIIIIDNLSSDGTTGFIKEKYPAIKLIEAHANLGFGKANNIGLRIALKENADYVFLLNQDAWVENNTIEKLIDVAASNKEYGIISPMHYDGTSNKFDYKFVEYIQDRECPALLEDLWFGRLKPIYETSFVNAAAWLIPVKCLRIVGGFDPLFPHYGEDVDYVQRVQYNKFRAGIVPVTKINHDSRVQLWDAIRWNKKMMFTIYLCEVKNINGSLRSNFLVFSKKRFDELTSALLYRQFKLFGFRLKLFIKILSSLRLINKARKISLQETAFL